MATVQTQSNKAIVAQSVFWCIFWIWMLFGFVSEEVIPPLRSIRTVVTLSLDMAMVGLAAWIVRDRWHWLAVAILVVVSWAITCLVNHEPISFWLNGLREFVGLMLIYPLICAFFAQEGGRERFLDTFDRQGLYFLLVQSFCIIYQFIKYGSGDMVGGSFGTYYSGQMSVLVYLVSFFLLRRRIDNERFFASLMENKIYLFLLLPTFLNETKVSFVMMALYFLLLLPLDRRLLVRMLILTPLLAVSIWVGLAIYNYSTSLNQSGFHFDSLEDAVAYFMFNDDLENIEGAALWSIENNRGMADVPRLAKIFYLAILDEQEPGHMATGFGIGHFKGGSVMGTSAFSRQYDWLLMGSVPYLFHIYIQLGFIGIVLLQVYWLFLGSRRPTWALKRDINLQLMLLAVVLIIYLYNDMLRNLSFCIIFFTLLAASWQPKENSPSLSLST